MLTTEQRTALDRDGYVKIGPLYPRELLDAIYQRVFEACTFGNMEFVTIAVARAQALVALTRLVERIEIHDQIQLLVRIVRDPRIGVGIVRAGLIQDSQRLTMAGSLESDKQEAVDSPSNVKLRQEKPKPDSPGKTTPRWLLSHLQSFC